jgi:SAM-dependent methyltransferase
VDKDFKSIRKPEDVERSRPVCWNAMFVENYFNDWRKARINKLVKILGKEWFEGKTILELGCGFGHVGKELKKLGCQVVFAEAREEYVDEIRKGNEDSDIYLLDNDKEWKMDREFDLIIHWGLLYHLENWRQDLQCCANHSELISLETEISSAPGEEMVKEKHYDAAVNGIGIRTDSQTVEGWITSIGCGFIRYDDVDLNNGVMNYTWGEGTGNANGRRRFWMIWRKD